MTSQHFDADDAKDDWKDWGDWGESNSNNNNSSSLKSQIQHVQPVQSNQQQNFLQQNQSAPIYSPFAYQPPQQQQNAHHIAPPVNYQQSSPVQQHQFGNQNYYNHSGFTDNVNNNQNAAFHPTSVQYNSPPNQAFYEPIPNSSVNKSPRPSEPSVPSINPLQYQPPLTSIPGFMSYMPPPSTSPLQLPPPPQTENITDDLYKSNQQKNLPAPPPTRQVLPDQNAGGSLNYQQPTPPPTRQVPEQHAGASFDYQQRFWQPQSVAEPFNVNSTAPTWQTTPMSQHHNYAQTQHQGPPAPKSSAATTEAFSTHGVNQYPSPSAHQTKDLANGSSFFEKTESTSIESQSVRQEAFGQHQRPSFPPTNLRPPSAKPENVENVQPAAEILPTVTSPPPRSTPNVVPSAEVFYPENRERLDDVSTPPSASSTSVTDRHNYLVTGQLSQERMTWPHPQQPPQQHHQQAEGSRNFTEELPPRGLSRMVVGQPENIQDQPAVPDVLPPFNRMVTGTETTPSNYMNYQRQADGEVSQAPPMIPRPQSNSPFTQVHHQNAPEVAQQSFNTSDRNLYLVAGESDINDHRVIPGVESNVPTIINPMQNLHIQDDDDFVNVSVSVQERNVNVDGMETVPEIQQQRSIDTEPREEDIDGANDNTESFNTSSVIPVHEQGLARALSNEMESDVREEAIEGANDYNDEVKRPSDDSTNKLDKSLKPRSVLSSEDSELRELELNKSMPKPRRSKKYDTNESENEYSDDDKRAKYRRPPRDKMSRDEYEKYRRREKERRSDERPRKGDDTDGSKYGESKRRTDDEDDYRRNRDKYKKGSRRRGEEDEVDDKEKKKREKYREGGSRRKDYGYDEERRERRRRERYHDDESYSGRRSQNTSDYDRYNRRSEKDRKYDANSYYPQYAGYDATNYNYSSYYQQQQYYETLRRTNPQAYYEWYTKYYAMMQQAQQRQQPASTVDELGGSMRSGYSSSNEKERVSAGRFLPGGDVSNPLRSMNTSFIDNTDYQSLQGYPSVGKDLNQAYSSLNYNHSYGYDVYNRGKADAAGTETHRLTPRKFQALHSFVRLSNGVMTTVDTSTDSYKVKIENIPVLDKSRKLYQSYPGPLVRGVSHKKTVIEFCEDKLRQDQSMIVSQRASYSLLWNYLILMLRQNGNYTEADISELLMKNSEEFKTSLDSSASDDNKVTAEDNTDVSESDDNVNSNSASQSQEETTNMSTMSEKVVLHKFRDYLLYGNINDALDFATDNNLWGHALFLASKVDRRQHANVMLKFANKLPYNDPLQTLYQIMSGRMPSCVTNLDDKWGDWRPHLAMIISNCTDKPELVKRSIMALGDSLASRGDIFASQFCYLLVDPRFKEYNDATSDCKIALLGTSHQKPFKEFATNDAIIMSEVYEYARSLSEEGFFVPSLQKYKYLLAANMLDYGMQLKCLLYMEQIAKCIVAQPDSFEASFISRIHDLSDRLKFYDPVMEKSYEDNFNNNGLEMSEDQKWLQDLSALLQSSAEVPVQEQTPQISSNDVYAYQTAPIPAGIYDPMSQHQTPTHAPISYEPDDSYRSQEQMSQVESFNQSQYQQQQQQQQHLNDQSYDYNSIASENQAQQSYSEQPPYDPTAQGNYQQQQTTDYSNYGGWDQNTYQQPQQQQQPTITMGNTTSNKFSENSQKSVEEEAPKQPAKRPEADKNKKGSAQDGSQSGGWFGGIFSKLSMKPKNQMILPDDKNPTIVWDEATKKWVNKDGDAVEAESFKPPPKMGNVMGNNHQPLQAPQLVAQMPQMNQYSQPQAIPQAMTQPQNPISPMDNVNPALVQQHQMPAAVPEGAPAAAAPNMFKMQKGRNLKKSYVDILGNSGQTVSQPKELAPQMDMQFFNPVQQQQQGMQFYNPNDFQ